MNPEHGPPQDHRHGYLHDPNIIDRMTDSSTLKVIAMLYVPISLAVMIWAASSITGRLASIEHKIENYETLEYRVTSMENWRVEQQKATAHMELNQQQHEYRIQSLERAKHTRKSEGRN